MDKRELQNLLDTGACIDERERNEYFSTVAGKLAREGEIIKALWLINRFGAAIEFVVHGLIHCINEEKRPEAKAAGIALAKEYMLDPNVEITNSITSDINEKTYGLGCNDHKLHFTNAEMAGDPEHIDYLKYKYLDHIKEIDEEVLLYAGHIYYLERLNKTLTIPNNIVFSLIPLTGQPIVPYTKRFASTKLALHTLSFIKDDVFMQKIVDSFKEHCPTINFISHESKRIRQLMLNYDLDFSQARDCFIPTFSMLESFFTIPYNSEICFITVKALQLMNATKLNPVEASTWMANPDLRNWFYVLKKGKFDSENPISKLPADIILLIAINLIISTKYLIPKKQSSFFINCIPEILFEKKENIALSLWKKKLEQPSPPQNLKKLNFSPLLFSKKEHSQSAKTASIVQNTQKKGCCRVM